MPIDTNIMSNYNKAFNQYKEQSVNTMTKIEMLTTLYDEAIKRTNRSKVALEAKEQELFESELSRAVEIIFYLDNTLDQSYAISKDLHKIYDYMTYELNKVRVTQKYDGADGVCSMLAELRDSFIAANSSLGRK
ncbi:MAG: flagellar export chaperone FliS [Oscillospiraceae bacterium]